MPFLVTRASVGYSDLSIGKLTKDVHNFHLLKQQWSEDQSCLDASVSMQSQEQCLQSMQSAICVPRMLGNWRCDRDSDRIMRIYCGSHAHEKLNQFLKGFQAEPTFNQHQHQHQSRTSTLFTLVQKGYAKEVTTLLVLKRKWPKQLIPTLSLFPNSII